MKYIVRYFLSFCYFCFIPLIIYRTSHWADDRHAHCAVLCAIAVDWLKPVPPTGTVKDDLYVLDIIVSEPCKNWDNKIYNVPARPGFTPDVNRPKLGMERYNSGYCYLDNDFGFCVSDCPENTHLQAEMPLCIWR